MDNYKDNENHKPSVFTDEEQQAMSEYTLQGADKIRSSSFDTESPTILSRQQRRLRQRTLTKQADRRTRSRR